MIETSTEFSSMPTCWMLMPIVYFETRGRNKTNLRNKLMISTSPLPQEIGFNPTSPFYSMISTFMVAVSGGESLFRKDNPLGYKEGEAFVFEGTVHKEFLIQPFLLYKNAQEGYIRQEDISAHLCSMLLNICYETVKEKNDKSPLFEFFRHIRNSCSHKNSFYFKSHEPSREAQWRTLTIDHNQKGTTNPLFGQQCINSFFSIGDAILLLWDIDQKYNE